MRKAAVIALLLLLAACRPSGDYSGGDEQPGVPEDVIRFEDREHGVVCYLYDGPGDQSLSCLSNPAPP